MAAMSSVVSAQQHRRNRPPPAHPALWDMSRPFARRRLYRLYVNPNTAQESNSAADERSADRQVNTDFDCRFADLYEENFLGLCAKPFEYITFFTCKALGHVNERRRLDFRRLSEHAPDRFQFLTTIYLTRTDLTDELLEHAHLEVAPNLERVTVAGNKLTRFPLWLIMQLVNLVEFNASYNEELDLQIDDPCLQAPIRNHPSLQVSSVFVIQVCFLTSKCHG